MGLMKEELERRLDLHKWEMLEVLRSLDVESFNGCDCGNCQEARRIENLLAKIETLTDPKP